MDNKAIEKWIKEYEKLIEKSGKITPAEKFTIKHTWQIVENITINKVIEKLTEFEIEGIKSQYPMSLIGTIIGQIEKMKN